MLTTSILNMGQKMKMGILVWIWKDCHLKGNPMFLYHKRNKFFMLRISGIENGILLYTYLQEICTICRKQLWTTMGHYNVQLAVKLVIMVISMVVFDNLARCDIRDVIGDGTPRNLVIGMETVRKCRCHNNDVYFSLMRMKKIKQQKRIV